MTITLRPQQVAFQDTIRKAFQSHRTVLGVASTGFGKSVVLSDMCYKAAEKGRKVLVVTNRRVIVNQLQEHCSRTGIRTGVIMGSEEADKEAVIQVASIQTLKRRGFHGVEQPGFLILDEAHNEFETYRKLLHERFPTVPALGMTATPVGPSGVKIGHFETTVEPIKNSEIIAAGDLLRVKYIAPSEPDMGGLDLKRASKDEIGGRVQECTVAGDIFAEWEPYSHMQTLAVFPSRAICNGFHQECIRRGISAKVVDGTTNQDDRKDTFSEFKETDCQMILGVDVIREGLDLPIAQCLIDLHPTHAFRAFWQAVGRVKRPHDGQDTAVVIDLAGNLWRHMVHPDQDPPWDEITNDKTIEEVLERKAGVRCPKCGSKEIYSIEGHGYKCEDCGETWQTKKPWVCPHCKQALSPWQRVTDGKCPNCGVAVGAKPLRRIRMEDGSLRTVPADEIKRRKKNKADSEQAEWLKWIYIAVGWNRKNPGKQPKTLSWCRAMFNKKTGHWPRSGMKYMPEGSASGEWRRAPESVFPWLDKRKEKTLK